jgi:nucleoside-diphosphate-sugar epimerase
LISVVIIGCGDIGRRVAARWRERGAPVAALTRRPASAKALTDLGITLVEGDLDAPESLAGLPTADALVYYFAPPPPRGTTDPRVHAFLAALDEARPPRRIVYISTSGVYGDRQGAWVDETAPADPQTDRARRRLDAENALRAWGREHGVAVVVLRVGGIYGPGRLPRERLAEGRPVLREAECGYTNRIHTDDLAEVCIAAAERGEADALYNASDGKPGTMTGYFNAVADRLGLPRPPAISMAEAQERLSPAMLSYLTESRRLDNRRMREELGVRLRYPELASGLEQAASEEE